MGWFDAPAGQANLLAGMSKIASHKIAEPNIGYAITSGLGKAVDAIKNRNDALIKEEANTKVREILSQPMDAKNPMAQAQALAPWLARADAEHQMVGKEAVANLFKDADFGIKKDTLSESIRHNKSDELLGTNKLEQQKIADANSLEQQKIANANALKLGLANVGVAQTNANTNAETLKMNLGQMSRNNAITDLKNEADGIVRNADGTLSRDYENKSFKASQLMQQRANIVNDAKTLKQDDFLKRANDQGHLLLGTSHLNSTINSAYGTGKTLMMSTNPTVAYEAAQLMNSADVDGLLAIGKRELNADGSFKKESPKFTKEGNTLKSSSGKTYNIPTQEWLYNNTETINY